MFRENPYLVVQATPTGKRVSDTLTRLTTRNGKKSRRNVIASEDYVVVTPADLDNGERVRVAYEKSFLDRADPVAMTLDRQHAGINHNIKFAENGQFTTPQIRAPKHAKVVQAGEDAGEGAGRDGGVEMGEDEE